MKTFIVIVVSVALFSKVSDAIEVLNDCDFGVISGGYCLVNCQVDNFDEENQYIALQKTVTYYHYDIKSSYGPIDLFTTTNGFVEEITNTSRYSAQNSTFGIKTKFTIRIARVEVGDGGQYTCQLRRKSNDEVIEKSHTFHVKVVYSVRAPQIGLQFGLKKDGTSGNNLVIQKIFKDKEKVSLSKEDYDNLVYVVNVTKIVPISSPYVKTDVDDGKIGPFKFASKYHRITEETEKLIPYHPVDVVYLYQPEHPCTGHMNIRGIFHSSTSGEINLEKQLNVECQNSAFQLAISMPLMCAALLHLIDRIRDE